MLKQVLLVLLSCCAIVTVRSQQPCLGVPTYVPHSFAAAPESCDQYIICMNGQTIRGQRCPPGMLFDPPSQTCGQTTCMECSPFGIQNLPHPDNCNQFIRCTMGNREIATCPSDLYFDRTIGNCNYAHLVYCPTPGPTPDPTDIPTESTTDWTDFPTETTTYWSWPPDDTTTVTPPPGGDRPICRGQVFHAHPYDCNRFFMCMDEVLWEGSCPRDLHWNQLVNACDLPERAGCLSGPNPTQPPTDVPTTTEPPLLPPSTPCP